MNSLQYKDLVVNNDSLNKIIIQEQEEYKKLIKIYNSMFKISSYYHNQIKSHQIEFENLKQKIIENIDLQEIIIYINNIFNEFNIKNHSDNLKENINILYNYILHLQLTNQENIKSLNIISKNLSDFKDKFNNIIELLGINKEVIYTDKEFNMIYNIISNIIEENKLLKQDNSQNNVDLIKLIKQLEDENKQLKKENVKLIQENIDLNNEINKLIKLEDEYNDYKIKQEEFLKLNNKTINDIHRKEIINLNEIQKQRIEENKKLLKMNEDLSKEVYKLKKGFADLDEYKKQILMLSKDVKTIKNSVSIQNFNEINNTEQNKTLLEYDINKDVNTFNTLKDKEQKTHSKSLNIIENNENKIYPFSNKTNSIKISSSKSPKEQLKDWFNNIDNKNRIRKQDIPDIHFKNISLLILLCKARNYYKLDNTDKMTYGQFKNYLYTISEIRNELL